MAARVLAMADVQEIRRLRSLGLGSRAIARALGHSRKTVAKYLRENTEPVAVSSAEIATLLPSDWTDTVEWGRVAEEARKTVPLKVLWEELKDDGKLVVEYPAFWKQFKKRFPKMPATMHRVFAPGSRAEIDYCDGIDIIDPTTGEIISTELFVGVLCHSRFSFAEFTLSQKSQDFLTSHIRMFEAWGGVPSVISPDNLKAAVTKAHRYDPILNPAYTRLATHYEIAVVPATVASPKQKAIVERTIQIFQRWFFYRVRHRTFTSLIELNQCLREHLELFHSKKHRVFGLTRRQMFEEEKAYLKALPKNPYLVTTHHLAQLSSDCHLVFDKNFYSAPYQLRGKQLDVWANATSVEIWHEGSRVAFHGRGKGHGAFFTKNEHYPPEHQAYLEVTPVKLREWSQDIGPETHKVVLALLSGTFPLRHLRRAQGILGLSKKYSAPELENACAIANSLPKPQGLHFLERLIKTRRFHPQPSKPILRGENRFIRGDKVFH